MIGVKDCIAVVAVVAVVVESCVFVVLSCIVAVVVEGRVRSKECCAVFRFQPTLKNWSI